MALTIIFPRGDEGDIDDLMDYITALITSYSNATLTLSLVIPGGRF